MIRTSVWPKVSVRVSPARVHRFLHSPPASGLRDVRRAGPDATTRAVLVQGDSTRSGVVVIVGAVGVAGEGCLPL